MPEKVGFSRLKLVRNAEMPPPPVERAPYVELGVATPFSFLRGASDAIELVLAALKLGMDAIGVADRNTLAGVVRMHSACKGAGLKPLIGCRLDLNDAPSVLAYPIDREVYGRLSRLLSLGKMRADKGECELSLADVAEYQEGIAFIAWPPDDLDDFEEELPRLGEALTSLRHFAASWLYRGDDSARLERLDRLARQHGCTILATNDVHYHAPDRRPLQDVVTCIREKVTIATAGYLLNSNAERHLKSPEEMARLFVRWPHAISATREFADALNFSLDELRYEYPRETVPDGRSPQQHLEHLTWQGAHQRWGERIPYKVLAQLNKSDPLLDIAKKLEEIALNDDYFISRKLYPNVDFYSGIIMRAIGIPMDMFTVMFAIGRMPGWVANYKEVMDDPDSRISRPRQIYTGQTLRSYTPMEQRN